MPKRSKEGGGGGGNNNKKKKKQASLGGFGKDFIKAGKWDKYKGTCVLMGDAIYGKKVPENARGKSFLYSVYKVSDGDTSVVCLSANQESKTKVKALCGLLLLYFRPHLCLLTFTSFTFMTNFVYFYFL